MYKVKSKLPRGLRQWGALVLAILFTAGPLPNAAYAAGPDVTVENFDELKAALNDQDVNTITVTAPITFTETLTVNRSISFVSAGEMLFPLDESFSGRHFSITSAAGPVTVDFGAITLDGGGRGGGVYVSVYNPVTLKGGTIQNCSNGDGGAVFATSGDRRDTALLTLEMDKIINNTASGKGGAVYLTSSSPNAINAALTISRGEINGNSASNGGAVYSFFGKEAVVSGGVLDGNSAKGTGGAFYLVGGRFSITDGMIRSNTSGGDGGAVYVASANSNPSFVEIAGGTFDGNSAIKPGWNTSGGAIFMMDLASFSMTGGVFSNNTASQGGAIANTDNPKPACTFTITGGTFSGNTAVSVPGGGALAIKTTPVEISNAAFTENKATKPASSGGAVYCTGNTTIVDCSFTGNAAYSGGAIAAAGAGELSLAGSALNSNAATSGGAISAKSKLDLSDCRLESNTAKQDGGAISVSRLADVTTDRVTFADNKGFFAYPTLPDGTIAATHASNIIDTTCTSPFGHVFNNYDIAPLSGSGDAISMGAKYFRIALKAGANGSLGAPDGVPPFQQANTDLTAADLALANPTADPGYAFDRWELADGTEAVFPVPVNQDVHLTAAFHKIPTVTLTFETNGGSPVPPVSAAAGSKITLDQATTRDGYAFTGWYGEPGLTTRLNEITLDTDKTVYAGWMPVGSGGSVATYTITFETNGGSPVTKLREAEGTKITLDQRTTREGYVFTGWYADQAASKRITAVTLTENMTVYAGWRDAGILNTNPRLGYMIGCDDGQFKPDAFISRAEVSTIFYRLLSDQEAEGNMAFADIRGDEWYAAPILVLASKGILIGDGGVFRPNDSITRAEFVTILSRLIPEQATEEGTAFSDVPPYHWASEDIKRVSTFGIINGYPDGTFRPDHKITRAEAVKMINQLLGRTPDKQSIDRGIGVTDFPDVPKAYWAYYEIQAAVNGVR